MQRLNAALDEVWREHAPTGVSLADAAPGTVMTLDPLQAIATATGLEL